MANSIKEYPADTDVAAIYTTPDYIQGRGDTDIKVYIDDVLQLTSAYTLNNTAMTLNSAPTLGQTIRIERKSDVDGRLTDYSDGALLTADTLDLDANQIFHVAQEAYDRAGFTNLASGKFYYSQGEEPDTTTAGTLWYDTSASPNVLKVHDGTSFKAAVPTKTVHTITVDSDNYFASGSHTQGSKALIRTYNTGMYSEGNSNVYLNGVRLVKAAGSAGIPASGDYAYNTIQKIIFIEDLQPDDIVTIETLEGSFVLDAATVQSHVNDYNDTYYPQMQQSNGLAADSIQANADINATLNSMGGLQAALNHAESAQNYATASGQFNAIIDGTTYYNENSAKHYSDLASSTVDTAVNTTIPNAVSSAEGSITSAKDTAVAAVTTQQAASVAVVDTATTDATDAADDALDYKAGALAAKTAAENAANVSADVLNGWATVSNNSITTFGSDDTELISSTGLNISAVDGVKINHVPTPKFGFVVDCSSSGSNGFTDLQPSGTQPSGSSLSLTRPNAGEHKISLGGNPNSVNYYTNTSQYMVQATYQGNTIHNITIEKATTYFIVRVTDASGNNITTGELLIFLYEL